MNWFYILMLALILVFSFPIFYEAYLIISKSINKKGEKQNGKR